MSDESEAQAEVNSVLREALNPLPAELLELGWLDPAMAADLRGERDACLRNWTDVQDAWERLLPLVEAAKAWHRDRYARDARDYEGMTRRAGSHNALIAAIEALNDEEETP